MRLIWRGFLSALLVLTVTAGVFAAGFYFGTREAARPAEPAEFDMLWTVRDMLERSFIGEIPSDQEQAWGAAHGMVGTYGDPYTVFVEPAPREMERDDLRGHFGGIGASMGRDEQGHLVLTVMRDRPAARAGVQDNDILLAVDGQPISAAMTIEEVVALVRGPENTEVVLSLRRPPSQETLTVTIIRERIDTPSVEWRVLDKDQHIGYARIALFGERTADELRKGLSELSAAGVSKLVLDLRGNGGGLVDAAIDISSQFIRDGDVLREVRRGSQERFYPVKPTGSPAHEWEIALLVDSGTASASEIVAGALRDQGRATLIGETTYGKGSVQEVHEFADGSSLHVTVARWLTPKRQEIDGSGLKPEVVVELTEDDRRNGRDPQIARAQAWLNGEH
jgi:carboxyl-terminal processing protease